MAKTATLMRTTDLEPIDRLEDKLKLLVELVTKLRADQAKAVEENTRLGEELHALRARVAAEAEQAGSELAALRDERDLIRSRVAEMLQQLEGI